MLLSALENHDADWQGYAKRQRDLIGRYLSTNPDLAAAYDDLLFQLLESEPAP